MRYKIKNKGIITQGIAENANPSYGNQGLVGHTGIDSVRGWKYGHKADNDGYVYKAYEPQQRADNWTAAYMIVPDGNNFMEICMGHFSTLLVKEGQKVLEGQFVGMEGNFGTVYSSGILITPEMQDAGDRRGSHLHESWRPVRQVTKKKASEYYLEGASGRAYRDEEGYYYEIIFKDNGLRGCVDPRAYSYYETYQDKVRSTYNALKQIAGLLALKQ